ncbi:HK97-gp10 family putative phage morphogenesis protein [Paludibaculum fermentans]|uniref:HK97-gp10 family putative phage morphogenesis protein n=1 Tax=Paludibaculum fermentans TaxID=1473598 RepID=UPI003EB94617
MAKSVRVDGLSKLERSIHAIIERSQGQAVMDVLGKAANMFRQQAVANAHSEGLPKEVADSIFAFGRLRGKVRKNPSALVGVKRGKGTPAYVEWQAAGGPGARSAVGSGKAIKATSAPGRTIGMSLATMFEFGTSKMPPRPFFAKALKEKKAEVKSYVHDELLKVLTKVD